NAAPSAAGVQFCMTIPFTMYITPNRVTGLAAVRCNAVSAGTMPSSSGSASVAPRPRSIVRRSIALRVIIIPIVSSSSGCASLAFLLCRRRRSCAAAHAERGAADDADDDGGPAMISRRRAPGDRPNGGQIVVLDAAADGVGQQPLGEGADEI